MRAKTISHAEYEILLHVMSNIDIAPVMRTMGKDEHSKKRVMQAADNVSDLIGNLLQRRLHKLPKEHPDYESKA